MGTSRHVSSSHTFSPEKAHRLRYTSGTPKQLVRKIEAVRAVSNSRLLGLVSRQHDLEENRVKDLASTSSSGVRHRLALVHSKFRAKELQKITDATMEGEEDMIRAIRNLGIRSPAMLADYFGETHTKTREPMKQSSNP